MFILDLTIQSSGSNLSPAVVLTSFSKKPERSRLEAMLIRRKAFIKVEESASFSAKDDNTNEIVVKIS